MERIAVASDDGRFVSDHFGGAAYFVVVEIDQDRVVGRDLRSKPKHGGSGAGKGRRKDSGRRRRIGESVATIQDCSTVVARGIGDHACEAFRDLGVRVLTTDLETVDQVAQAAVEGRLEHHPDRVTRSPAVREMGQP